ncbi:MAG: Hsp20/alpha crystallin family protein [Firmicutes bacterium]|nr:Hsp20/alpha crystallin family protein [Bacillota bacterium]
MANALARLIYDPLLEMDRIRGEVNRLLGESLGRFSLAGWMEPGQPPIDIYATNDELILVAAVPGLAAKDLEITTNRGFITIAGEFTPPDLPEKVESLRQERWYGRFSRTFQLPLPVEAEKAEATMENGLLFIRMPKAKEARTTNVPIKVK